MTKEKLIEYIMETPNNQNRAVLSSIIDRHDEEIIKSASASPEEITAIVKENFPGGVGYEEVTVTKFLNTVTYTYEAQFEQYPNYYQSDWFYSGTSNYVFLNGDKTYYVVWDGKPYVCTPIKGDYGYAIGNLFLAAQFGIDPAYGYRDLADTRDTGEPFAIYYQSYDSIYTTVVSETAGEHTFTISECEYVVHKIDKKFVPNLEQLISDTRIFELSDTIRISDNVTHYGNPFVTEVKAYKFRGTPITKLYLPAVEIINEYAFNGCKSLTTVNFPLVTSVGARAFGSCSNLTIIDFPSLTSILDGAFADCTNLTIVDFPLVTLIEDDAFEDCSKLTTVDFPLVTNIKDYAFSGCKSLTAVILRNENRVATLTKTNTFTDCNHILGTADSTYNPDGLKDGYIYVPRSLVDSYKTASKWSTFATQFRALEDYTIDGTVTGELDPSKI